MNKNIFYELSDKYLKGTATPEEKKLVEAYYEELSKGEGNWSEEEKELLQDEILSNIKQSIKKPPRVIPIFSKWRKIAAAASILLFISTSSYFLFFNKANNQLATSTNQQLLENLPPGRNAAVLTLGNGSQILLDSTLGTLNTQGAVTIINTSGLLTYESKSGNKNIEITYHSIATARGNQYQLILADGTKVWLNSASTLRFPIAFTGATRQVELTGEGYFEVAKNPAMPFHVTLAQTQGGKMDVQVLGTHFNINSYKDEPATKTTLLEGSVKITLEQAQGNKTHLLKPGEQSRANEADFSIAKSVDIENVMAWQKGLFEFSNTDLPTILRQISRWYDVDIVFEGKPTSRKFGGGISRNLPLAEVLHILEGNDVKFKLEGKVLKVTK